MIKPGMLLQWKSTDQFRWGWYYKEKPLPTVQDDNVFFRLMKKVRIYEENLNHEHKIKLLDLQNRRSFDLSQVKEDENKFDEIKKIHAKYSFEAQEIEDQIKLFNFQYALMAIDKLVHTYKVGNVVLREKIYWQCIMTKRNGEALNVWVEEEDVEPYVENSYDIKNILLAKHLARRAVKKK